MHYPLQNWGFDTCGVPAEEFSEKLPKSLAIAYFRQNLEPRKTAP
jgi:hypothetical protein